MGNEIRWSGGVGKNSITYSGSLYGDHHGIWELTDEMYKLIKIESVVVETPEEVVELPIPTWVDWQGDGQAWLISTSCFKSEAPEIVRPFVEKLAKFSGSMPEFITAMGAWLTVGLPGLTTRRGRLIVKSFNNKTEYTVIAVAKKTKGKK